MVATATIINPSADPQSYDDERHGFEIGTQWFNRATGALFICLDPTLNAAVWQALNLGTAYSDERSGFVNRTDSTLTFTDGTRTFQIAPTTTSYEYLIQNIRYEQTEAQTVVWPDVEGIHFFYFDTDNVLSTTQDVSVLQNVILGQGAYVAAIYWDATNGASIIRAEERHGFQMNGHTHAWAHASISAQLVSGGALGDLVVDGNGSLATHAQFSVATTVMRDEDIEITITDDDPQPLAAPAEIPIFYRTGASGVWRRKTADTFPIVYNGTAGYSGTLIPYNENTGATWQFTELANNEYVYVHYFASNDLVHPILGILGQNVYNTPTADDGIDEVYNLDLGSVAGLIKEVTPIASVLFQALTGATNTPKAAIQSVGGNDYVDLRRRIG